MSEIGAIDSPGRKVAVAGSAVSARAEARRVAESLGWGSVQIEELVICASEIAQNIVDHGGGRGILQIFAEPARECITLESQDLGEGFDPMRSGAPPRAGGGGNGIAAIGRLMDAAWFRVGPGPGPRLRAWKQGVPRPLRKPRVIVVQRLCPGEEICGDAFVSVCSGKKLRVGVVDGLGHGTGAHAAAEPAVRCLEQTLSFDLGRAVSEVHETLRTTRGGALGALEIDLAEGTLYGCVVGNVRLNVFSPNGERWSPLGLDAVVGQGRPGMSGAVFRPAVEQLSWTGEELAVMFSDGLSSRLLPDCPIEMAKADLVRTAFRLFAAHAGERDDATLALIG